MELINIYGKQFAKTIHRNEIQQQVQRIGNELNQFIKTTGEPPLFLCVLNGAFMFASDLLKEIKSNCLVSFVKYSSYKKGASTSKVNEIIGLNINPSDRHVIVLEDIVDTGITMNHLIRALKEERPKSVQVATMFFKPGACQEKVQLDHVGLEVPNRFLVGYGLDYDGFGRNFKDVYELVDK